MDRVLIRKSVRSGTSIGANYREANNAESEADFPREIGLRRKESDETQHGVELVIAARPDLRDGGRPL
jgi:four helix bundle protein